VKTNNSQLERILEGKVEDVIEGLLQKLREESLSRSQSKALEGTIRYFENHRQWMKYDEYLSAGYPIGTGVVESTCGHTVKDRMEGSGRRWSIEGAEATLLLRSVYTSGDECNLFALGAGHRGSRRLGVAPGGGIIRGPPCCWRRWEVGNQRA